ALKNCPMMSGDRKMLTKCINYIKTYNFEPPILSNKEIYLCSDKKIKDTILASYDMHCFPNMILQLQAIIPFPDCREKYTTHDISSFIWENSSKINYRNKTKIINNSVTQTLHFLQNQLAFPKTFEYPDLQNPKPVSFKLIDDILDQGTSRLGFLRIFGKKYRMARQGKYISSEVIIAGTIDEPCRIKSTKTQ